jgi:hypothetical protein
MQLNGRNMLLSLGAGVGAIAFDRIAGASDVDISDFRYDLITDWLSDISWIGFGLTTDRFGALYRDRKDFRNFHKKYNQKSIDYAKFKIQQKTYLSNLKFRESAEVSQITGVYLHIETKITLKKISVTDYIGAYSMEVNKFVGNGEGRKSLENRNTQPSPFNFSLNDLKNVDDLIDVIFPLSHRHMEYIFECIGVPKAANP